MRLRAIELGSRRWGLASRKGQSREQKLIEFGGGLGAVIGLWVAATQPHHPAKLNCSSAVGKQQGPCLGHAITATFMPYVIDGLLGVVLGGAVATVMLLLWRATRTQLQRNSVPRLATPGGHAIQADAPITDGRSRREPIPERVRHEVWRRDRATCVDCGSRERLEFDHIIPVSKGGSNTARNIELRCETCNHRKGARI